MPGLPTPRATQPPPLVLPGDVLFDEASAVLKPLGVQQVDAFAAKLLVARAGARVRVIGHTDSRGPSTDNIALSLDRAQAVLDRFALAGFDRSRLGALGAGEGRPLRRDTTAGGVYVEAIGKGNRRVEISVTN